METVLIVDDNKKLLESLADSLVNIKPRLEIFTAEDGEKAIQILKKKPVSLLVTDMEMPKVDGLELLAYVNENHPEIPCILMTGHPGSEKMKRIPDNLLKFILKPFSLDEFATIVIQAVAKKQEAPSGVLNGISLVSFLQVIEMEEKTCLLEIQAPDNTKGVMYFEKGVPFNAIYGDLKGENAAYALLAVDNAIIRFRNPPAKKIQKRISADMMGLCMEAMRRKDETFKDGKGGDQIIDEEDRVEQKQDPEDGEGADSPTPSGEGALSKEGLDIDENQKQPKENLKIALENYIQELREIKGYKAAGIMEFTGDLIAHDSVDDDIDLGIVGAVFNDIFRSSHEASHKVNLGYAHDLTIKAPEGIVVMVCSGKDARSHFHIIGVLEARGNQALMRLKLDKMIPKIMEELG